MSTAMSTPLSTPLTYLAWTLVLALAQVVAAAIAKRTQEPPLWAAGPRDEGEPRYTGVAGRLNRAQANLFETLPLFIGAVLICHAAGRESTLASGGAGLFFWGRVVYVGAYLVPVPFVRTLIFVASTAGLVLVLVAALTGA